LVIAENDYSCTDEKLPPESLRLTNIEELSQRFTTGKPSFGNNC
jgi:hypothetical protein